MGKRLVPTQDKHKLSEEGAPVHAWFHPFRKEDLESGLNSILGRQASIGNCYVAHEEL